MENRVEIEVDGLLREHFRQVLPNPWPPLRLPVERVQHRAGVNRGRLSLAASLVFLLVALGLVAGFGGERSRPVGSLPSGGTPVAKKPGVGVVGKPATNEPPPTPR
jgi:hypothetical protein